MLFEFLLGRFADVIFFFLDMLPKIRIDSVAGSVGAFETFLAYAAYFLPMNTIFILFSIIVAEEMFKIALSVLKLAMKLLPIPFVG